MSFAERLENRKKQYKTGLDAEELKKNRENNQFSLRKKKRYESMKKRRNIGTQIAPDVSQQYLDQLPQLLALIMSDHRDSQTEATRKIRMVLSLENNPPIEQVVTSTGLIPRLISFLECFDSPQLQLEAAWCLTNIASGTGECTTYIVQSGVIQAFVKVLSATMYDDIKEQAIWGLGNIAGDCTEFRDLVLQAGALKPLCNQINESAKLTMLRNATWALSNFSRGKPLPSMDIISEILIWLCKLVYRDEDEEIMIEALWAFSYLTEGSEEVVGEILRSGVARRITDSLLHHRVAIKIPALRTVGNIVAGNETHTQLLINVGVLPCLSSLLTYHKYGVCKEACWAISNITAGNHDQINSVINANIIPPLILLIKSAKYDIKIEAAWSIANICTGGNADQVRYVVGQGCITPLCDLLEVSDHKVIDFTLDALQGMLNIGLQMSNESMTEKNQFAEYIEHAGGLQKLEQLTYCDDSVAEKASRLIEKFFSFDEESRLHRDDMLMDESGAEVVANQSSFDSNKFQFKF